MSLTIGENVGAYRIVEQLGQGGMATVFKAYHASLDRYVAIKVLHPAFKEDPTFLARFQREARVVAKLEHPNIVPVYDYADHNGAPYLVMKFIEGETLKAELTRGAVNLANGLHIIEAVGAGLAYAHRQGILHRDIKPSNVMLANDGNIYLADFGLARIALAGESTLSTDSMLGTPHYMSPEQAKGVKDLDAGTDIYSLGVVIYELVVGRVPYSADTPFAIIHDHIFTPLPMPHTVNPNVPETIERVLLKALAKDRADRYQDVNSMVAAFRDAVTPYIASHAANVATALPRPLPIAPSAVTPAPGSMDSAPGPTVVMAAPAAGAASAPVAPAAKKGYTFKWWHALIGAGLIMCCLFFALAAATRGNRLQSRAATETAAAPTVVATVEATSPATPPPPPPMEAVSPTTEVESTPAEADVKTLLVEAEQAFDDDRPADALKLLDQAIALEPQSVALRLQAGDLALENDFALHALDNYYVPASKLAEETKDPLIPQLREHTALAFYIAAADTIAIDFIQAQRDTYPDPGAVNLAGLRYRVFHDAGDAALREMEKILSDHPDAEPEMRLLMGDYFLKHGDTAAAQKYYNLSLESKPAGRPPVFPWLRMEAECEIKNIQENGSDAKLEASCEDPSSLLTGR
jgi:predicted Ser/Thr protein kinase/tetratricopeptide (TPR) repeat protein